jgi:hypothetical protein
MKLGELKSLGHSRCAAERGLRRSVARWKPGRKSVAFVMPDYLTLPQCHCSPIVLKRLNLVPFGSVPGFPCRAKIATARFYADHLLPQAAAFAETVMAGDAALAGVGDEVF